MLTLSSSFVMITGPCPGAGKTTLAAALQDALRRPGNEVFMVPEAWLFEWPDFADVGRMFKEHRYPSATDLLVAFERLRDLRPVDALWLQDWSWIDLAEDLPWALEDFDALVSFSRELAERARSLMPLVLYLDLDPAVGVRRAAAERGDGWFRKSLDAVEQDCATREPRLVGAIEAGGWRVCHVDGSEPPDSVLRAALSAVE